jgi:hypothetical protein
MTTHITADSIGVLLEALAGKLSVVNMAARILLFGGAILVTDYQSRAMTHDLDVKYLSPKGRDIFFSCADEVAEEFGLDGDWVNDRADQYNHITPEIIADAEPWKLFEYLEVLRPSTRGQLAMKIEAARLSEQTSDADDAAALLSVLGIADIGTAVGIWREYYPDRQLDELVFRDKKMFLTEALSRGEGAGV